MKYKHFIYFLLFVVILSCTHDIDTLEEGNFLEIELENTSTISNTNIEKNITINVLAQHFDGFNSIHLNTRALSEFSISPFVFNGDTVMYVVQYDKGWELYSADLSMEMIPFSSEEGVFNFADPNFPDALKHLITEAAEHISENKKTNPQAIDSSWGPLATLDLSAYPVSVLNPDGTYSTYYDTDLPPGHWELIETKETKSKEEKTSKLTATQWGQNSPWNTYSDLALDSVTNSYVSALAGCGPVAMAQYVYATHCKDGSPSLNYIKPILKNHTYTFEEDKTQKFPWEKIILEKSQSNSSTTSLLIGYIGHLLNAQYDVKATPTRERDYLYFFKKIYGSEYQICPFETTTIKNTVKSGYPIFTTAQSKADQANTTLDSLVGHVFLIDQYKLEEKQFTSVYGLVRDPLPAGSENKWVADLKDAQGNIIKYAYIKTDLPFFVRKETVSMNWGWNGKYADTFLSITGAWPVGKYNFDINKHIFLPKK